MKPKRSPCPIACTLDAVGDRWTLLVVRDLLLGRTQFKEFAAGPERIATNILSDRLARLVALELVETFPSPDRANATAYRLTNKGKTLAPVIKEMAIWGLANLPGTEAKLQPKSAPHAP